MPNVAFGSLIRREEFGLPQRGRNRPAGCREAFEGGPKRLASRKPIRREEAGFGQATERPQQACRLLRGF